MRKDWQIILKLGAKFAWAVRFAPTAVVLAIPLVAQ